MIRIIRSAFSAREPVNNPLSGNPSPTKQEFKKEVNINEIIDKMRRGISPPPWMTSATPRYGDFTEMPASFMDAHNIVEKAQQAFAALPLGFRRALDHDFRNLDKAPRELYEQYGLLKKSGAPDSPIGDSGVSDAQRVQGDRDLPAKAPSGAKRASSKNSAIQSDALKTDE